MYLKLWIPTILLLVIIANAGGEAREDRPGWGGVKYRILVDKVYCQGREQGKLVEEDYKQISQVGFNIICPRYYGDNPVCVEEGAKFAQKYGMYYMVWLRGSLPATIAKRRWIHSPKICVLEREKQSDYVPVKYTLKSGYAFDLLSPNSDELWEILEQNIMAVVKLSKTYPILGVFLDFELYARPLPKKRPGHLYDLSYDQKILDEYAKARGISIPKLPPKERFAYLSEHNLYKDFAKFQVRSWRNRLRELRRKIDAINPAFQFAVYPSSYTLFVNEAVWKELATPQAPILAAEHYTYTKGFPNKDKNKEYWKITDDEGIKLNVQFIQRRVRMYRARGVPYAVIGGIDPINPAGDDPVFQSRSAVAMSKVGDGYWMFYEGIKKNSDKFYEFEKYFRWANNIIAHNFKNFGSIEEKILD